MSTTMDTTVIGICQRMTLAIEALSYGDRGWQAVDMVLVQEVGVSSVYVNVDTEMAYVVYNPHLCQPQTLIAADEPAGFRAETLEQR